MASKEGESYPERESIGDAKWPTEKDGKNDREAEVCRNFLNNRCLRGALCKFQHPEPDSPSKPSERNRSRSPIPKDASDDSSATTCRDFLRNMCTRGKECRFYHPTEGEVEKKSWFTLCLDFQNGSCSRHDCRYFHVTPEDENLFRDSGEVSIHLIEQAIQKAPNLDVAIKSSRPTCKDFLKGYCKFKLCRFRHVSRREYEDEVYRALKDELYELVGTEKLASGTRPLMEAPREGLIKTPVDPPMNYGSPSFRENPLPKERGGDDGGGRQGISSTTAEYSQGRPQFPREGRQSQFESHRREFGQQPQDPYRYAPTRNRLNEALPLDRKQNSFRGGGNLFPNTGFSTSSFSDFRTPSSNDSLPKLQLENDRLRQRIDDMMIDLNSNKNWENLYYDTKAKLIDAERQQNSDPAQIRSEPDKVRALEEEINILKGDVESWEKFEYYVMEQARLLQNHLTVVENELAQSWGGGPPPMPSQRDAWGRLRSILMLILNPNIEKGPPKYRNPKDNFNSAGPPFPGGSSSDGQNSPYPQQSPAYNNANQNAPPAPRGLMDGPPGW